MKTFDQDLRKQSYQLRGLQEISWFAEQNFFRLSSFKFQPQLIPGTPIDLGNAREFRLSKITISGFSNFLKFCCENLD